MTDSNTTEQMMASAFMSPSGEWRTSYNPALNLFTGFILAKRVPGLDATLSVSSFLNIRSRNGLSNASEITENSDDNILKLK